MHAVIVCMGLPYSTLLTSSISDASGELGVKDLSWNSIVTLSLGVLNPSQLLHHLNTFRNVARAMRLFMTMSCNLMPIRYLR